MLTGEGVDLTGADLSRRLRSGDADALAEAYRRWGALVHTVALHSVGDHHDAEDVTQQVFVSAWRSRATLREDLGSLPGWLVAITRRRCADLHARRARDQRLVQAAADAVTPSMAPAESDDAAARVLLAQELAELGDPRATVIRLAVIEGRTHQDVADRLGMPLGTVKSHVRRGLLHLRDRLEEVDP